VGNKDFISILVLIAGGLMYSLISFAYMQDHFISKDMFDVLVNRLDRIESKIDGLN